MQRNTSTSRFNYTVINDIVGSNKFHLATKRFDISCIAYIFSCLQYNITI